MMNGNKQHDNITDGSPIDYHLALANDTVVEDVDLNYSMENSPPGSPAPPVRPFLNQEEALSQSFSEDEEDSLIEYPSDDGEAETDESPTKTVALHIQTAIHGGDSLESAFQNFKAHTAQPPKTSVIPRLPPAPRSSPQSVSPVIDLLNGQKARSSPVTLRRVSSMPSNLVPYQSGRASSPRKLQVSAQLPSTARKPRPRGGTVTLSNSGAHALRRQVSLPTKASSSSRKPLLLHVPERDDSVASASSIGDEDLANLAKELATPKRKNKNVFRSVKLGTPTNFRRSETPREEPETPKSEELRRIDTAKTDGSAEDFLFGSNVAEVMNTEDTGSRGIRRRIPSPVQIENAYDIGSLDLSSEAREVQPFLRRHTSMAIVYLSVFSSFGSIIRIFGGRLFGLDCEFQSTQDWLSPFSQQICITSSGMSTQRGGALFTDLPANMLGSFIIGVLTVLEPSWPALPWLEADHPLQEHEILHVAIKVGMCGSLTTFSSWNSQMVAMMDGSQSELGSQVAAALFGYMVGTMGAVASFLFGTHVSTWLNHWRNPNTKHPFTESVHDDLGIEDNFKNDVENPSPPLLVVQYPERTATRRALKTFAKSASTFIGTRLPFIIFGVLFASFLVGDFLYGIPFYRFLWLEVIVTPPAALLRWFLALRLNDAAIGRGRSMGWLPQGTLCANILGSVVSILMLALEYRRSANGASGTGWRAAILSAIRVGGAGSLSTVSTFAKELVDIAQHFPHQAKAYYYGLVSIASALVFSLIIYIPIVRHS